MDIAAHNSRAWDKERARGNQWTIPVSPEQIARARNGLAQLKLTPQKPVPLSWVGAVKGKDILCLASGGGQQGPIFAAMGARVTVFDNSPSQLDADRLVALREGLELTLVRGDMRDLSAFADDSFDLIFHPVANTFIDDLKPLWRECARVLKPGGDLLAGFVNPLTFIFDYEKWDEGELQVCNSIPYSDLEQLPKHILDKKLGEGQYLEFGHSLEEQIGGQLKSGLVLLDLYEDNSGHLVIDRHISSYMATRARKPIQEHA